MNTQAPKSVSVLPERVVVIGAVRDPDAPLTADDLMTRGYSKDEAYALLRRFGVKVPGGRRKRIAVTVLERIERGELAP